MEQSATVLLIEGVGLSATFAGLVDAIADRWRAPVPPDVLEKGWDSLHPMYRRRVDRTVGGMLRRMKLSIELSVKRWARK